MILLAAVKRHFCGAPARTSSLTSRDNGTHLSREAHSACCRHDLKKFFSWASVHRGVPVHEVKPTQRTTNAETTLWNIFRSVKVPGGESEFGSHISAFLIMRSRSFDGDGLLSLSRDSRGAITDITEAPKPSGKMRIRRRELA